MRKGEARTWCRLLTDNPKPGHKQKPQPITKDEIEAVRQAMTPEECRATVAVAIKRGWMKFPSTVDQCNVGESKGGKA